ncbi:hypothetical protein EVAR_44352_1 [Eumeta japonica]|uniref:Uncharacterized protein n=1 Tax=Eumeta variegata TaxID=151549 RepID=A0A4C1X894_EUMVA|nr:hypothetical protein EVAR_44352_1 [Eumeta japonica]
MSKTSLADVIFKVFAAVEPETAWPRSGLSGRTENGTKVNFTNRFSFPLRELGVMPFFVMAYESALLQDRLRMEWRRPRRCRARALQSISSSSVIGRLPRLFIGRIAKQHRRSAN